MKPLRFSTFIGLIFIVLLSSCTIEKRVHRPGYHTQWKKGDHNPSELSILGNNHFVQDQDDTTMMMLASVHTIDNSSQLRHENIVASVDNSIDLPSLDRTHFEKKEAITINPSSLNTDSQQTSLSKKEFRRRLKEQRKNYNSNSENGSSGAGAAVGGVLLGTGLLVLLFASILIGALMMIAGIVVVAATGSSGGSKKEKPIQYIDVLYLKNGSVIRGMIIEQTPNVSLKIQTKDGSIFVYDMEDVLKFAKEPL